MLNYFLSGSGSLNIAKSNFESINGGFVFTCILFSLQMPPPSIITFDHHNLSCTQIISSHILQPEALQCGNNTLVN